MSPRLPRGGCEHPERPARASSPVCHTGTVRVLVVEDERRLASAVRRGLTAEGFVVDVAHDGVDGLHLAREGGYDAVVLDLMLPGLSGYQVCERLRAERNWVPVLILSAKDGLIEHGWDSDAVADLNVVEVYAGYVRRKIDTPFGRNALQTVRGAGYRLAADGG